MLPSTPTSTALKQPGVGEEPVSLGLRKLLIGQQELFYRLRRSKRRTIGFVIDDQGLRITAPNRCSISQIDQAIIHKQAWILAKLLEREQRSPSVKAQPIIWLDGTEISYLGKQLTLKIITAAKVSIAHDDDAGTLTFFLPAQANNGLISTHIQTWLKSKARQLFAERLTIYTEKIDVHYSKLALSSATTRWGSCSADGKIRLNWRLIHFSLPLIDYVVAHEVAHLKEMNHSARFWAVVEALFPNHATARKALRAYVPGSLPVF